jgi:hypothetical protein
VLTPLLDPSVLLFSVVPIIFAIQVVRFSQGKTTYMKTLPIGILYFFALLGATFFGSMIFLLSEGVIGYSGPIPLQLIVGYCLIRHFDKKRKREIWID